MAKSKKNQSKDRPKKGSSLLFPQILIIVAGALSGYLLVNTLGSGGIAGCGPNSGCDEVLNSSWASLGPIPVSAFALATYAFLLFFSFAANTQNPTSKQQGAWNALIPAAFLIIFAALWFSALQFFVIKTVCPLCMTTHGVGLVAAILLLKNAPLRKTKSGKGALQPVPGSRLAKLAGLALVLTGTLIAGQTLAPRPSFVMEVYDGKFQVDVNTVPTMGDPKAPHRILTLFDYTCRHCRILHGHLEKVHSTFKDELCIVNLPMPLGKDCNHLVRRDHPDHVQACEYARLGLAMWRIDKEKFHKYEKWIFGPAKIPSLQLAASYAADLVGRDAIETALKDPWISQQISNDVAIYAESPKGNMPQTIIGTNITYGTPGLESLYSVLEQQLGLKRSP